MVNRILLFMTAALLILAQPCLGESIQKVQKKMGKAIQTESKAQAKADEWTLSKDDLVNEIRDLQTRLTWLEYQKNKHEIYVQKLKDNIATLEAKKLEARKLRENLEPYLEEIVARLVSFVETDMPFLPEERQQRQKESHIG